MVSIVVSIDPDIPQHREKRIRADRAVCQRDSDVVSEADSCVEFLISVRSVVELRSPSAMLALLRNNSTQAHQD